MRLLIVQNSFGVGVNLINNSAKFFGDEQAHPILIPSSEFRRWASYAPVHSLLWGKELASSKIPLNLTSTHPSSIEI